MCDLTYPEEKGIKAHLKTAKHLRKEGETENPSKSFAKRAT